MQICQSTDINQKSNVCLKTPSLSAIETYGVKKFLLIEIFAKYLNFHLSISIICDNPCLHDQGKKGLITLGIKLLKSSNKMTQDFLFNSHSVRDNCLFWT